jgi:hypothetical protein
VGLIATGGSPVLPLKRGGREGLISTTPNPSLKRRGILINKENTMTFVNMDGLLILGMLVFTASLWLILKAPPVPIKIKKENRK